jgi:hypothetical protein
MQILSSETLFYKLDPALKEELESMDDNEIQIKYRDLIAEFAKKYRETIEYKCNEEYVYPQLSNFETNILQQYNAPWWEQYTMLMQREISRIVRDRKVVTTKISTSVIVVVFMVLIFHKMGISGYDGFQNFVGFFLMMSDNLIITGINNAMRGFPDTRMVFMRDQVSGLYSVSAFYSAFVTSNLPLALLIPSIYILFGFLMTFMLNGIPVTFAKLLIFCIA